MPLISCVKLFFQKVFHLKTRVSTAFSSFSTIVFIFFWSVFRRTWNGRLFDGVRRDFPRRWCLWRKRAALLFNIWFNMYCIYLRIINALSLRGCICGKNRLSSRIMSLCRVEINALHRVSLMYTYAAIHLRTNLSDREREKIWSAPISRISASAPRPTASVPVWLPRVVVPSSPLAALRAASVFACKAGVSVWNRPLSRTPTYRCFSRREKESALRLLLC